MKGMIGLGMACAMLAQGCAEIRQGDYHGRHWRYTDESAEETLTVDGVRIKDGAVAKCLDNAEKWNTCRRAAEKMVKLGDPKLAALFFEDAANMSSQGRFMLEAGNAYLEAGLPEEAFRTWKSSFEMERDKDDDRGANAASLKYWGLMRRTHTMNDKLLQEFIDDKGQTWKSSGIFEAVFLPTEPEEQEEFLNDHPKAREILESVKVQEKYEEDHRALEGAELAEYFRKDRELREKIKKYDDARPGAKVISKTSSTGKSGTCGCPPIQTDHPVGENTLEEDVAGFNYAKCIIERECFLNDGPYGQSRQGMQTILEMFRSNILNRGASAPSGVGQKVNAAY
jgi:tetratricopeptide (TPR) repeat protein